MRKIIVGVPVVAALLRRGALSAMTRTGAGYRDPAVWVGLTLTLGQPCTLPGGASS
ncbi:hypothetical protein [Streptomyces sp. NPDC093544]|uniref:hypothetical protein n=1 Tax=Streptomyces sp. NPDC093544 TaxID=3155200 RepID=UPI00342ABD7F